MHVIVAGSLAVWPATVTKKLLEEIPPTGWSKEATIGPLRALGLLKDTVVGPVIWKQPVHVLVPPSGLVNVTSCEPGAAAPSMSTSTFNAVPVMEEAVPAVISVPENAIEVPGMKPDPLTVMACPVRPGPRWAGEKLEARGAGSIVRQPVHVSA
ncbi:MAG: hypothetical protein ACXVQV_11525 [Actinomycetota bacterium]